MCGKVEKIKVDVDTRIIKLYNHTDEIYIYIYIYIYIFLYISIYII